MVSLGSVLQLPPLAQATLLVPLQVFYHRSRFFLTIGVPRPFRA